MTKHHTSQIISATAILLTGIICGCSTKTPTQPSAETTPKPESDLLGGKQYPWTPFMVPAVESFAFQATTNTDSIAGSYYGIEHYTNGAGSFTITPSNGVSSFTFSDISGIPAPYNSWAIGFDKITGGHFPTNNVFTNTVTFSVISSHTYNLTVFIKNPPPPPTNGQAITLKLHQN